MKELKEVEQGIQENIEHIAEDVIKHWPDDLLLDRIDIHCSKETNTLAFHILAQIIKGNMVYPAVGLWQVTESGEKAIQTLKKLVVQELSPVIADEEIERTRRMYESLKARRNADNIV